MKDNSHLTGSFVLVMVLGIMMILSWISIFELYLSR